MSSPQTPFKILIIRLSAIGDTIHCLPVASALKRKIPGVHITWLVEPASRPLLEDNPAVDQVLVLNKKLWSSALAKPSCWGDAANDVKALVAAITSARFDLTLDLQGLIKSSLWTAISQAPLKVGFATAREGAPLFFTDRIEEDYFRRDRHVVDTNLLAVDYICRKLGITGSDSASNTAGGAQAEFPLPEPPEASIKRIRQLLADGRKSPEQPNVSMVRNVVLIPGTTWPSKVWDWQSWAKLGRLLAELPGWRVCLTGGASEQAVNRQIADSISAGGAANFLDLTGKTSLLDLIALFRDTELVVGADTGPLHLAAAVGTPRVVAVHGSTPTIRNGPYGPQCSTVSLALPCQPCFKKKCPLGTLACLKDLTAESVFARLNIQGAMPGIAPL